MPEEVRFLGRSALFGLVLGTIYWFVSYEPAGTILLVGFGVAAALAALKLALDARSAGVDLGGSPLRWFLLGDEREDPPFGDEAGQLPGPTAAPLFVGLGLALAVLSLAFGPFLLLAAVMPMAIGGWSWISDAVSEYRAVERQDRPQGR